MLTRSDNRQENHPKPVQNGERKQAGAGWVDWDSIAEVIAGTNQNYRRNKYYWIAGTLMQCDDDGLTFRRTDGSSNSGGAIRALLFIIGTGSVNADFDGFKPAGNQLQEDRLYQTRIVSVNIDGTTYNSFNDNGFMIRKVDTAPASSYLDFSQVGGLFDGQSIIILYQ